jgi:hypothetical protein
MVRANPAMLAHYREKMIDQIEKMLERDSRAPGFEEPSEKPPLEPSNP